MANVRLILFFISHNANKGLCGYFTKRQIHESSRKEAMIERCSLYFSSKLTLDLLNKITVESVFGKCPKHSCPLSHDTPTFSYLFSSHLFIDLGMKCALSNSFQFISINAPFHDKLMRNLIL